MIVRGIFCIHFTFQMFHGVWVIGMYVMNIWVAAAQFPLFQCACNLLYSGIKSFFLVGWSLL